MNPRHERTAHLEDPEMLAINEIQAPALLCEFCKEHSECSIFISQLEIFLIVSHTLATRATSGSDNNFQS
jgi:hypothetical protein